MSLLLRAQRLSGVGCAGLGTPQWACSWCRSLQNSLHTIHLPDMFLPPREVQRHSLLRVLLKRAGRGRVTQKLREDCSAGNIW